MSQQSFSFMEALEVKATNGRTKACKTCKEVFPETNEFFNRLVRYARNDGTVANYYHPSCKACQRKANSVLNTLHKTAPPAPDHCECCGRHKSETKINKLVLDHCHQTGVFRGWLCDACNRGIGGLGDDLTGVLMAVEYLKKTEKKE